MNNKDLKKIYNDILEWNKKTFKNATLLSQIKKFFEEYKEYKESGNLEELADCYIVLFGMNRFKFGKIISNILKYIYLKKYFDFEKPIQKFIFQNKVIKEIKEKYKINLKRKWIFKNGSYHHKIK